METLSDDDMEWMEKYGKDHDHFHANYVESNSKHKNDFVAIKSLKVYHDANPRKLMELLMADGVDTIIPL